MTLTTEDVSGLRVREYFIRYRSEKPFTYDFQPISAYAYNNHGEFSPLEMLVESAPHGTRKIMNLKIEHGEQITMPMRVYGIALIPRKVKK